MRPLFVVVLTAVIVAALMPLSAAAEETTKRSGTTYVTISDDTVTVGNALIERTWTRDAWATTSLVDKRTGMQAGAAPDFTLDVGTAGLASDRFTATDVTVEEIAGGLRATVDLALAEGSDPALSVTRVIETYEGIAGMRTQTTITPLTPLVLRGYTIEQAAVGNEVAPTLHAFRAGADWREPDWGGPQLTIGDPHAGTWRDTRTAGAGKPLKGAAQWISTATGDDSLFMVMERNDWPSSRAGYADGTARLNVDYSADIIITGPFEEEIHAENPQAGNAPGRHRVLRPGTPYQLEAAFVGFGTDTDDEPWQFYKYLSEHRLDPYDLDVTFNSNGTDDRKLSEGAKDDMNFEVFMQSVPIAERLGIETFILDDGWQAVSGDWYPDCPEHPEPRWNGDPASQYAPRFPDCEFSAVRRELQSRGMELGLWMSPMHFHPASETYRSNPHLACMPIGHATAAQSIIDPDGGSNDAGIGTWSSMPQVMTHVESRIQNAIDNWGVTYFKFDFLVWLDCAGQNDMYEYKEAFIDMLDRLIAENPDVTFQIDETNDYRLFPFESVTRSPSWFQNGSPAPDRLLHNLWNLSPYVPAYSLGQHFLGGNQYRDYPVDTLMAISLPGHPTFFSDLRRIPLDVVDQARPWTDFHRANKDHFRQMTYPLLADPIEKKWTALQTWDPEAGKGALLAFRQQAEDATRTIALRNVPSGMTFDLFEGPSGAHVGTATSEELRSGIEVTIPVTDGARVLLIQPAEAEEFDPTTTLTYDGTTSVRPRGTATLGATLTGTDGPIPGATVTFSILGETLHAVTDAAGRATVTYRMPGRPGTYEVVMRYAGSDRYLPTENGATITVAPQT